MGRRSCASKTAFAEVSRPLAGSNNTAIAKLTPPRRSASRLTVLEPQQNRSFLAGKPLSLKRVPIVLKVGRHVHAAPGRIALTLQLGMSGGEPLAPALIAGGGKGRVLMKTSKTLSRA